ncbi:MAG: hypothetical protein KatS3mg035_0530 [Bacteroidia bacterium]|nr:MAG: hypothetical protein KatS3mg035_0530 [Bacteroidia bacterium]
MLEHRFIKDFLFAFTWGVCLIGVSIGVFYIDSHDFQWNYFLQFDAVHYYKIVHLGYNHKRSAFFPLFPWIWKILGGKLAPGLIINNFIFSVSFAIINQVFYWNIMQKILFLSIPSSIFYFLPYSESIFALGSACLIYSITSKKDYGIVLSFLLISFSRPAFSILLPSLAIYLFFEKFSIIRKIKIFGGSFALSATALWLVNEYQYSQTKIPWGFYSSQQTFWDNHWRLPHFPLSSYGDIHIFRVDLLCFVLGMTCVFLLISYSAKKIYQKTMTENNFMLLIYSYLAGISLLVLFTRGGSLFSLNRFMLASFYGGIFMVYFPQILRKSYLPFILLSIFIVLNGYSHIRHILVQLPIFIPLILLKFYDKKWAKIFLLLLFVGFQLYFMQKFMLGEWIA